MGKFRGVCRSALAVVAFAQSAAAEPIDEVTTSQHLRQVAQAEVAQSRSPEVQVAQAATSGKAKNQDENVIVTGTRQVNRTVLESLAPINVLSTDSIAHTGTPSVLNVLSDVLPSFNIPAGGGGDITSIVRQESVRGLPPDNVLVLVNGKRRHVSAITGVSGTLGLGTEAVDLNLIPQAAIERIEVLTDGASAQYGSDALAGVVNLILKDAPKGGSLVGGFGEYRAGDGRTYSADADMGFRIGEEGRLHIFTSLLRQEDTSRAGPATITLANFYTPGYALPASVDRNAPLNKTIFHSGLPTNYIETVGYNARQPLFDDIEIYSNATYGHADQAQWENYRQAGNVNTIREIFPNGMQPRETVEQNDYSFTVGGKGWSVLGWTGDVSTTWGKNISYIGVDKADNASMGLNSPTKFFNGAWIASEITNNLDLTHSYTTGLLPYPVDVAFGLEGRLDNYRIQAGDPASYEDGGFKVLSGPAKGQNVQPGAQSFFGFLPSQQVDQWRQNFSTYLDLESKITSKWDIGIAGRFENYSDFGSTTNGLVKTRYQVVDGLALRGSVATGFRAPSLGEEFYSTATNSFSINPVTKTNDPYTNQNLPPSSAVAAAFGAKPLQPVKSTSYSAGFIASPTPAINMTLDAYQIDLKDFIVETGSIGVVSPGQTVKYNGVTYTAGAVNPAAAALLQQYGINGIAAARFFFNGVDLRDRGIDVAGDYKLDFDQYGELKWTLAANLNYVSITGVKPIVNQIFLGTQYFTRANEYSLLYGAPKYKVILTADYNWNDWGLMMRNTLYGSSLQISTSGNNIIFSKEQPKILTDIELFYDFGHGVRLTLGAQDAFDIQPNTVNPLSVTPTTAFQPIYTTYNTSAPFGFQGAYYYTRVSYVF